MSKYKMTVESLVHMVYSSASLPPHKESEQDVRVPEGYELLSAMQSGKIAVFLWRKEEGGEDTVKGEGERTPEKEKGEEEKGRVQFYRDGRAYSLYTANASAFPPKHEEESVKDPAEVDDASMETCDECGEKIPAGFEGGSAINTAHDLLCSLHPNNSVGEKVPEWDATMISRRREELVQQEMWRYSHWDTRFGELLKRLFSLGLKAGQEGTIAWTSEAAILDLVLYTEENERGTGVGRVTFDNREESTRNFRRNILFPAIQIGRQMATQRKTVAGTPKEDSVADASYVAPIRASGGSGVDSDREELEELKKRVTCLLHAVFRDHWKVVRTVRLKGLAPAVTEADRYVTTLHEQLAVLKDGTQAIGDSGSPMHRVEQWLLESYGRKVVGACRWVPRVMDIFTALVETAQSCAPTTAAELRRCFDDAGHNKSTEDQVGVDAVVMATKRFELMLAQCFGCPVHHPKIDVALMDIFIDHFVWGTKRKEARI